ncbi:MAG: FHA domain-containing protein [Polyangiales bacterium]
MIICPKCGKENQDHYKFCLGCGNELPREPKGAAMRPTPAAVTPPAAPRPPAAAPFAPAPAAPVAAAPFAPPVAAPPAPAAPPMVAPVAAPPNAMSSSPSGGSYPAVCPQCASPNPRANRFCITCGFDMSTAGAAPASAVATTGVSPLGAPPPMGGPVPTPMASPVAPAMAPPVAPVAPPVAAPVAPVAPMAPPVAAPAAPVASPSAVERARLVLVRPDGSEGPTHALHDGENRVGRDVGGVFSTDTYLSPHHATFTISGAMITIRDEGALNGVYVRIERQVPVEIQHGDVFRIGQEILRYESLPAVTPQPDGTERLGAATEGLVGRVSLVTGRDSVGNAFPVPVSGIYLGRERGDILFPEDGYVSGLHCQLIVTGHRVSLLDVGSSNGTYVRMRGPRTLNNGDFLLLGQQLFRLQVA